MIYGGRKMMFYGQSCKILFIYLFCTSTIVSIIEQNLLECSFTLLAELHSVLLKKEKSLAKCVILLKLLIKHTPG